MHFNCLSLSLVFTFLLGLSVFALDDKAIYAQTLASSQQLLPNQENGSVIHSKRSRAVLRRKLNLTSFSLSDREFIYQLKKRNAPSKRRQREPEESEPEESEPEENEQDEVEGANNEN